MVSHTTAPEAEQLKTPAQSQSPAPGACSASEAAQLGLYLSGRPIEFKVLSPAFVRESLKSLPSPPPVPVAVIGARSAAEARKVNKAEDLFNTYYVGVNQQSLLSRPMQAILHSFFESDTDIFFSVFITFNAQLYDAKKNGLIRFNFYDFEFLLQVDPDIFDMHMTFFWAKSKIPIVAVVRKVLMHRAQEQRQRTVHASRTRTCGCIAHKNMRMHRAQEQRQRIARAQELQRQRTVQSRYVSPANAFAQHPNGQVRAFSNGTGKTLQPVSAANGFAANGPAVAHCSASKFRRSRGRSRSRERARAKSSDDRGLRRSPRVPRTRSRSRERGRGSGC